METLSLPLYSEEHGTGSSSLVLLHGFALNGYTWHRWAPRLAEDHRVVVVEMKGSGSSPKPRDGEYGPVEQASLLYRLILQKDLEDLTLVGHSLGGGICLLTALLLLDQAPERLRRLVVVAGSAFPQPLPPFIRLVSRPILGPLALGLIPPSFYLRKALRLAYYRPGLVTESQVQAYAAPLRDPAARRALSRKARQILPTDIEERVARYGEITVPSLLIWGREDTIVPLRLGRRLARALPSPRMAVIPECGHMPQEEKPEESLALLTGFLQDTP